MEKFTVLLKIRGATDNERNTPLLIASMRGLCGVMELLLAASADAVAKNKKGKGVLDHTKEIKDEEKRAAVLALMAECSVLCAVATGKADLVAAAVAKGCNMHETDKVNRYACKCMCVCVCVLYMYIHIQHIYTQVYLYIYT